MYFTRSPFHSWFTHKPSNTQELHSEVLTFSDVCMFLGGFASAVTAPSVMWKTLKVHISNQILDDKCKLLFNLHFILYYKKRECIFSAQCCEPCPDTWLNKLVFRMHWDVCVCVLLWFVINTFQMQGVCECVAEPRREQTGYLCVNLLLFLLI